MILSILSLLLGPDMEPYINPLLERLIPLLKNTNTSRTLAENAAITTGRLGRACPQLAMTMDHFVEDL